MKTKKDIKSAILKALDLKAEVAVRLQKGEDLRKIAKEKGFKIVAPL